MTTLKLQATDSGVKCLRRLVASAITPDVFQDLQQNYQVTKIIKDDCQWDWKNGCPGGSGGFWLYGEHDQRRSAEGADHNHRSRGVENQFPPTIKADTMMSLRQAWTTVFGPTTLPLGPSPSEWNNFPIWCRSYFWLFEGRSTSPAWSCRMRVVMVRIASIWRWANIQWYCKNYIYF